MRSGLWGHKESDTTERLNWTEEMWQEAWVRSLGQEDLMEEERAMHSSIFAWEIPWTEEPGGLPAMEVTKSPSQLSNWAWMQNEGYIAVSQMSVFFN